MTTLPVTIRDLESADLARVAELEREIFGAAAWSEALIRDHFAEGVARYRGIDLDGAVVAYAVSGFDGDAFHLLNVAVAESERGRGLGGALLDDALALGVAAGAGEAWLEVAVTNDAALAMYRARGFKDVRIRPRYYQPEGVDALVMRAALRPSVD